jgi:hypothetical protein
MKGFSAWPGKIEIPTDGMKRPAMKKVDFKHIQGSLF